jgi:uncharacterized protein (TIGR00299 family) protein
MTDKILYIEAVNGISGDMMLGALLDLGVPVEVLYEAWNALGIDNYEIEIAETSRSGMKALHCRVETQEESGPKSWKQYDALLQRSKLRDRVLLSARALIRRLFEIEAAIHQTTLSKLHLHEMGGTDLLIDVVGTLTAIDEIQPSRIESSPVNTGKGFVTFSHGTYPVPTPVATNLLEGVSIFQNDVDGELTTPTGALLLTHLARSYGSMPRMKLQKVGTGAGERDIPGHPNVVRIFSGELLAATTEEDLFMLESNIDDSNPQILAYFMEKAFHKGALDVFFTPIVMKKNRPATRLSVLTSSTLLEAITELLFTETTAIGLRYWKVDRKKLERRWKEVTLGRWKVRIKESYLDGTLYNYQPEYEDCRIVAEKSKRPMKEVMAEAIHLYKSRK